MRTHVPLGDLSCAPVVNIRSVLLGLFVILVLTLAGCLAAPRPETATLLPSATSLPTETPIPTPFPTHIPFTTAPTPDQSVSLELVGQNGGIVTAYAVNGNMLYVAFGANLRVYDITNPASPQQLGNFPLSALVNSLAALGNRLYALDRGGSLLIFDVQDPANLRLLQALEQAGNGRLFLLGEWGLATMESCNGEICSSRLNLVLLPGLENLPTPTDSNWIAAITEVPGKVLAVEVSGDQVYIGHTKGILTARFPDLTTVGDWTNYDPISGVAFKLPYAYLNSRMFITLDLSNPAWPGAVYTDGMYLEGPLLVHEDVLWGFQSTGYCSNRSANIDVSNPGNPRLMKNPLVFFTPGCIDSFIMDNGLIFLNDHGGLNIFNVDRPDLRLWTWLLPNVYGPVDIVKDRQVFGIDLTNRLVLGHNDVSDPQEIESVRSYDAVWALNIIFAGQEMLIAAYDDGLKRISAEYFEFSEKVMESEALGGIAMDVAMVGDDRLVVARLENGVAVVDFKDPSSPAVVGEFVSQPEGDHNYAARRVVTVDGLAAVLERYLDEQGDGVGRIRFLSLDDPTHPADLGTIDLGKPYSSVPVLFKSGAYVLSLTGNCAPNGSCSSRILVLQVKEGKPRLVQMIDLPYKANDLYVLENYMFLAVGEDGVQVWDISNLGEPRLVGQADTIGTVEGIAAENGLLYVSDGANGLAIFKYTSP